MSNRLPFGFVDVCGAGIGGGVVYLGLRSTVMRGSSPERSGVILYM